MDNILDFLKEKKTLIDNIIKKYIPENLKKEDLEFIFGKARYEYDIEALQKSLSDPVWEFLNRGGKRWRPALFLLLAEAFGVKEDEVRDFVVLFELLHEGSIIIDDIEDNGELRRGKPCLHKIFGIDTAINAGNFLYFLPLLSLMKNKNKFDEETILRVYEIYSQEMINIHAGQATDIYWHKTGKSNITEKQYFQMCAYKTGTLARMVGRMAVAFAGKSKEIEEKMGKIMETIGIAFQIQDDILDIVSAGEEREKFGKAFGNDITEGKRTLMVIHTLNNASLEDRKRLDEILKMHTKDKELINEAIEIIKKYDSISYAKSIAKKMIDDAWKEADSIIPESEAKHKFKTFVEFLINRKI